MIADSFLDELQKVAKEIAGPDGTVHNTRDYTAPGYSRLRGALRTAVGGLVGTGLGTLAGVGLGHAFGPHENIDELYAKHHIPQPEPVPGMEDIDRVIKSVPTGAFVGGSLGMGLGAITGGRHAFKKDTRQQADEMGGRGMNPKFRRAVVRSLVQNAPANLLGIGSISALHAPAASAKNQIVEHALRTGQTGALKKTPKRQDWLLSGL